jgi:hypothetical protein
MEIVQYNNGVRFIACNNNAVALRIRNDRYLVILCECHSRVLFPDPAVTHVGVGASIRACTVSIAAV